MKELIIDNKKCFLYEDESDDLFIMPCDSHDLSQIENIIELTKKDNIRYNLLAIVIDKWDEQLSPWYMEPIFKGNNFKGDGNKLIDYIDRKIISEFNYSNYYLIGYSLAGLFSLYGAYRIDRLSGVASVSGSLWYKDWIDYMNNNKILCHKVYLSLGDLEHKSRNPVMASVLDNTDKTYVILKGDCICFKEINSGNHFKDFDIRMAKAIKWLSMN